MYNAYKLDLVLLNVVFFCCILLFLYDFVFTVNVQKFQTLYIMKTHLYNFDPLKPHFYTVKLEFTGVYNILLISAQKK